MNSRKIERKRFLNAGVAVILVLAFVMPMSSARTTLEPVLDDVEIEDVSDCGCEGCELEMEIIPAYNYWRISMIIRNVGDADCIDVEWNITVDGGIILLGRVTTGIIPCICPGENVTVSSGLIIGFGRTLITISAESAGGSLDIAEYKAFLFLFCIVIPPK